MTGRVLIAANLRRLRLLGGYSQERLAHDAHVERSYLWKLEAARANPTIDVLDRIAGTLNIPVGELLAPLDPDAATPPPLPEGARAHRKR